MWREHIRSVYMMLPKLVQENVDAVLVLTRRKETPPPYFFFFGKVLRKWRSQLLSNMQLKYQSDDLICSTKHSQNPLVDVV